MADLMMPDYLGAFNQGMDRGRQRGLSSLMGQAFNAPADQRQNVLAKLAGVDGGAAIKTQQALSQADDDVHVQLAKRAKMVVQLAKAGQQQMAQQAYAAMLPVAQRGGFNGAPPQLTPELLPGLEQLASAMDAQEAPAQQRYLEFLASQVPEDERQYVYRNAAGTNPRARVQLYDGANGAMQVTLGGAQPAAVPIMQDSPGQPPQAPPTGTNDRILEIANAMAQAGVPDAQIEAWMSKQPGIGAPQAALTQGQQLQPKVNQAEQVRLRLAEEANARAEEDARRRALGSAPPGQRFRPDGTLENIPGANPTGQAAKPPSDGEKLSAGFLLRMKDASSGLQNIEAKGYTPGGVRDFYTAGGGPLMNWAASEKGQVYRQQQEDWVRAKLRKESGAAIPAEEMEREIKTYFPQPGDSEAVIKSKAKSRATALRAMEIAAGRAASLAGQSGGVAPDKESPPVAGARKAPDGNWYVQQNGQWYRVE